MSSINYSYSPDFYHLTMAQGFFNSELVSRKGAFELFFREASFKGGFTVFAGLSDIINAINNSSFTEEIIDNLKSTGFFKQDFLEYLLQFKFKGDIWSMKEGEIIFPQEPIMRVEGTIIEVHIIESLLLNIFNFQSMIATKSARISNLLKDKPFFELGLRRAFGLDGALSSTRASFIGGAKATSNVFGANALKIPLIGSMSHSWVMSFESELESFLAFGRQYPQSVFLLIDTYDILSQGLPHAIKAFKILKEEGIITNQSVKGIRIDSGDLDTLSKRIRFILNENGLEDVSILVSNELDEGIIEELLRVNAPIDFYGIGTNLVNATGAKPLGGVYKMVAIENEKGEWEPKIKVSNNSTKTTTPAIKNVIRLFNKQDNALVDFVVPESELDFYINVLNNKSPVVLKNKVDPFNDLILENYHSFEVLLKPIMKQGELQIELPPLKDIQSYLKDRFHIFTAAHIRVLNPHLYVVGFSESLISLMQQMIFSSKNH